MLNNIMVSNFTELHALIPVTRSYRWFSWGVASLNSVGQESGSVFSATVYKIQASKCYVESLPLVLTDRRSCFSQYEKFAIQLPLDRALALQK